MIQWKVKYIRCKELVLNRQLNVHLRIALVACCKALKVTGTTKFSMHILQKGDKQANINTQKISWKPQKSLLKGNSQQTSGFLSG